MPGLFQAMEIGKRALLSHQYSLQTTGHNIANVNTPGYTRQRVMISPSYPAASHNGPIGSGIMVTDIQQMRDLFLGEQYREAQKSHGQWTYRQKTLSQVESVFNEPNDAALGDLINQFWDSWSQLATDAGSLTARNNVLTQANLMVNSINQLARKLEGQQTAVNRDLDTMTSEINRYTAEIARLNEMIIKQEVGGYTANDLRDARELLVDDLSNIIDVRTVEQPNGASLVYMGSMILVDGDESMRIGTETENIDGQAISRVIWEGTEVQLTNLNGQLRGLVESRDVIIPGYISQLDELARAIVQEVNGLHSAGYGLDGSTGVNFFDPGNITAATIRINVEVQGSGVGRIAAASAPDSDGDNRMALAISDLRHQSVVQDNSLTIDDYYRSLVGKLGVETKEAGSFSTNYSLLINQVDNARMSVQGVSLDEEMANLIKHQHAYDAAARLITTMDEALDTVIFRMGV